MKAKKIVLWICCFLLICNIYFTPTVSADEGASLILKIYKIGKEDLIESIIDGEADWSYKIWFYDGYEYQVTDWIDCSDNHDTIVINRNNYFTAYSSEVSFEIAIKERDYLGNELADISSKSGGGKDSFDGYNYGYGANYDGIYNLKTDTLSGDQTDTVELGGKSYYWTSGSKDGSDYIDENDASLWFSIIEYYTAPIAYATATPQSVYIGESISFDASYSTSYVDIAEYYWDFQNDGYWDDQNKITNYIYNTKGTHTVKLKIVDSLGEESIYNHTVYVKNKQPTAAYVYSPNDYPHPTTLDAIQFTDTSTDSDGTLASWYWSFGDGTTSTEQNPTHQYSSGGTYTVTLKATDNDGDYNTNSKSITVIELGKITGTVTDKDGNPISGCTVKLYETGTSNILETKTTNTNGEYTISEIATDTYDIEASITGYDNNKKTSKKIVSGENIVDFVLNKVSPSDDEEGTPGFEIFIMIIAFALIIVLKRRKHL